MSKRQASGPRDSRWAHAKVPSEPPIAFVEEEIEPIALLCASVTVTYLSNLADTFSHMLTFAGFLDLVGNHGKQFARRVSQAITCNQTNSECNAQSVPDNPLPNPLEAAKRRCWCARGTAAVGREEHSRLLLESYTR
jgi:hypothetical protein